MSLTLEDLNMKRFLRMRLSSSSSSPDCELTSAMADSSARLMALPWPLPPMRLVMMRRAGSMSVYVRMIIIPLSMWVLGAANERQNLAPSVLGMISERMRMRMVSAPAKMASPVFPWRAFH